MIIVEHAEDRCTLNGANAPAKNPASATASAAVGRPSA
jgi:hypothetical protein